MREQLQSCSQELAVLEARRNEVVRERDALLGPARETDVLRRRVMRLEACLARGAECPGEAEIDSTEVESDAEDVGESDGAESPEMLQQLDGAIGRLEETLLALHGRGAELESR